MEFPAGQNPPDKLPVDTLPVCAEKCKRMRLGVLGCTVFSPLYSLSLTFYHSVFNPKELVTLHYYAFPCHLSYPPSVSHIMNLLPIGFWYILSCTAYFFGCCLCFKHRFSVQGVARSGHNIVNPSWFFWILWEASHIAKRKPPWIQHPLTNKTKETKHRFRVWLKYGSIVIEQEERSKWKAHSSKNAHWWQWCVMMKKTVMNLCNIWKTKSCIVPKP